MRWRWITKKVLTMQPYYQKGRTYVFTLTRTVSYFLLWKMLGFLLKKKKHSRRTTLPLSALIPGYFSKYYFINCLKNITTVWDVLNFISTWRIFEIIETMASGLYRLQQLFTSRFLDIKWGSVKSTSIKKWQIIRWPRKIKLKVKNKIYLPLYSMEELSSCDRDLISYKVCNIYFLSPL